MCGAINNRFCISWSERKHYIYLSICTYYLLSALTILIIIISLSKCLVTRSGHSLNALG